MCRQFTIRKKEEEEESSSKENEKKLHRNMLRMNDFESKKLKKEIEQK